MKRFVRSLSIILAMILTTALVVLPAAGVVAPTTTAATAAETQAKPTISATVSAASVTTGQPITVSGTATGNVTSGVQIWVFAGNYVNVSTVPVRAGGSYSKTFDTTGLPKATYYVFVQHPGGDNKMQITTSGYSGQVINANTGAVIFNFTGTGSVQDNAAATALSNALNTPGIDDIYTKVQFAITTSGATSPATTTAMMPGSDRDSHGCIGSAGYTWCEAKQKCLREWEEPCTASPSVPPATAAPTTAKTPLPPCAAIAGFALACCAAAICRKQ
ncbi:MAG: hypothetical protein NTV10_06155 [Methanoregula sp.]|jgi:hypothetical protein|nr:hypothetical protein [Methanoregula sp.]